MKLSKRAVWLRRERERAKGRERGRRETANKRAVGTIVAGELGERWRGRKREITLSWHCAVGATLNCGLPTLINFGRFISSCSTRRGNDGGTRGGEAVTN